MHGYLTIRIISDLDLTDDEVWQSIERNILRDSAILEVEVTRYQDKKEAEGD